MIVYCWHSGRNEKKIVIIVLFKLLPNDEREREKEYPLATVTIVKVCLIFSVFLFDPLNKFLIRLNLTPFVRFVHI